ARVLREAPSPTLTESASFRSDRPEEVEGVGDDAEAREAFAQLRIAVQTIPKLVERRLDLAVGALEERVDGTPDVVADLRRNLGNREPRFGPLLEPFGCLPVRLVPPPGVEEGRHESPIGCPRDRASTLFA